MSNAPQEMENGTLMRVRYNALPMIDIALGRFERGVDGATYLNGGMSRIMGFGGRGNVFKTYKMSYLSWAVQYRYRVPWHTFFDTEESAEAQRQNDILLCVLRNNGIEVDPLDVPIRKFFAGEDDQKFTMSNISKLSGTDWYEDWIRNPADEREKVYKSGKKRKTTPFYNIFGELEKVLPPWIHNCDSLSEWHSKSNDKETMKAEVGASESNHLNMTDYNHKAQMLQRWPRLAGQGEYMMNFTVQLTDNIEVGRQMGQPQQKLDTMKNGIKLSGVPAKQISYLTNSLLIATQSGELNLQGGYNAQTGANEPMFPRGGDKGRTSSYNDLRKVTYTQWRAKSGPTGIKITLLFSQEEGLLAGLSEWYYLKETMGKNPWGWKRSGNFYSLDILPDVKFGRTTIRDAVEENRKLARAMTITQQICYHYNNTVRLPSRLRMTADELYQRIIDQGYDWDEILTETVDWWMYEEDKKFHGKHTLTIYSLLEMAMDLWEPKFLTRKKPAKKTNDETKLDEAA